MFHPSDFDQFTYTVIGKHPFQRLVDHVVSIATANARKNNNLATHRRDDPMRGHNDLAGLTTSFAATCVGNNMLSSRSSRITIAVGSNAIRHSGWTCKGRKQGSRRRGKPICTGYCTELSTVLWPIRSYVGIRQLSRRHDRRFIGRGQENIRARGIKCWQLKARAASQQKE